MPDSCGSTNPDAPDMKCDLPTEDHAEGRCPVEGCEATHEGKHANHSRMGQKEIYQWRSQ